ncbi:hypothetical protein ACA910_022274 [Epithemia clementina (nom. ined.)]
MFKSRYFRVHDGGVADNQNCSSSGQDFLHHHVVSRECRVSNDDEDENSYRKGNDGMRARVRNSRQDQHHGDPPCCNRKRSTVCNSPAREETEPMAPALLQTDSKRQEVTEDADALQRVYCLAKTLSAISTLNSDTEEEEHYESQEYDRDSSSHESGEDDDPETDTSMDSQEDQTFVVIEEVPNVPFHPSTYALASKEDVIHLGDFDLDHDMNISGESGTSNSEGVPNSASSAKPLPRQHLVVGPPNMLARSTSPHEYDDAGVVGCTHWGDGRKEPHSPQGKGDTTVTEQDSSYSLSSLDDGDGDHHSSPRTTSSLTSFGKHVMITISSEASVSTTSSRDSIRLGWQKSVDHGEQENKGRRIGCMLDKSSDASACTGKREWKTSGSDRAGEVYDRIVIVGSMSGDWDDLPRLHSFHDETMDCSSWGVGMDESVSSPPYLSGAENANDAAESAFTYAESSSRQSEEDITDMDTPQIAIASQYLNPSPVLRRNFSWKSDRDLVLDQAVGASPVSERRKFFMPSTISTSDDQEVGFDPLVSTPLRVKIETVGTGNSSPSGVQEEREVSMGASCITSIPNDDAAKGACMAHVQKDHLSLTGTHASSSVAATKSPSHKRQSSLTEGAISIFRSSPLREKDASQTSRGTTMDLRQVASTSQIYPFHTRQLPHDEGLLAASATPVNIRRELFMKESNFSFRKSPTEDLALQAASSTSVLSRRAAFPMDANVPPPTPERHFALMASAAQSKSRRTTWTSNNAPLLEKSSLESLDALQVPSMTPVNQRREAVTKGFLQTSCYSLRLQAELDALKQQSLVSSRCQRRNRRARNDRLFFRLGQKKGGMSDKDYLRLDNFLPRDRVILELKATSELFCCSDESVEPALANTPMPLLIWLTNPKEKIFEIVNIANPTEDMTVEEVLEKACSLALDPVLSEQQYVSLCNRKQEIVTSSKPITSLLENSSKSSKPKRYHTLMAVPFGSTASLVRAIRRVLEKTERVKRVLNEVDPQQINSSNSKKSREWV